jgi:hypothetical protein
MPVLGWYKEGQMSTNPKTLEGVYRDGKVELLEAPSNVNEARVLVTFLTEDAVNLSEHGIEEDQAASLRARLSAFVEDWDRPEMGAYDAL